MSKLTTGMLIISLFLNYFFYAAWAKEYADREKYQTIAMVEGSELMGKYSNCLRMMKDPMIRRIVLAH